MSASKRVAFHTLGCRLNQYETEALATQFKENGYSIVDFKDSAEVYIINTCAVTAKSDQKSRYFINQARKKPNALVVATGCYATHQKEQLESTTGLTFVVPNQQKSQIFSMVDAYFKGELYHPHEGNLFNYKTTEDIFHTRAMIKIQDGCDNQCSFCIIPAVRGRATSRPLEEIIRQAEALIEKGYKEIILTGVNMSRYEFASFRFVDVLKTLLALQGDFRLRLSSLEPENISEEFIELLSHPKMCQHLHLCLQSGSNRILMNMHRTYNYESYKEIVQKIKKLRPLLNLTTDIIVGFPGEDEKDFALTMQAIQELQLSQVHIFKYSPRPGTRAARMEEQVEEKIKNERAKKLAEVCLEAQRNFYQQILGHKLTLLTEKVEEDGVSGYTDNYIYAKIPHKGKRNVFIQFVPNKIVFEKGSFFVTI